MSENNLKLMPVNDLLGKPFYVPDYQRGYRWTRIEVKALLDDIWAFYLDNQESPKDVYYCLQPVVVIEEDAKFTLVDGQQRLTTIYLILTYLNDVLTLLGKKKYTMSYATRPGSEDYLQNIRETEKLKNIDYFHIWEAYQEIGQWFDDKDGGVKIAFINTLLNTDQLGRNVKVIWYEIDPKDAVAIFTRINMGKIPLTNAELIKALFLRKDNFPGEEREQVYLKQLEIASEWDRIENTLQKEPFWYFIHDNATKYDTRIEFLFDLLKGKTSKHSDSYTFAAFSKDFETQKISAIWLTVKKYFMALEEWFTERTLFHYVGYLIATGSKVADIFPSSATLSKEDFKDFLKGLIKKRLGEPELETVEYGHPQIKNILLLYNIETMLQNEGSNARFQFDQYKKYSWDIEHISSVMSDIPSLSKSRKWLEHIHDYFVGPTVFDHYDKSSPEVNDMVNGVIRLLQKETYTDREFANIYYPLVSYFKEDYQVASGKEKSPTHYLSNLTLLDSNTNRSYQNAVFPVKRKRILKNDVDGLFVPLCTRNIFLKYYSNQLNDVLFWQQRDADDYLANMQTVLSYYL